MIGKTVIHEMISVTLVPAALAYFDVLSATSVKFKHNEQPTFRVKVTSFGSVILEAHILRETGTFAKGIQRNQKLPIILISGYDFATIPNSLTCASVEIRDTHNFTFACSLPLYSPLE